MTPKQKLLLGAASLAILVIGIAVGHFTTPAKIEKSVEWRDRVEYRVVQVEKKVEGPVRVKIVTRVTPGPQGPVTEETRTEEHAPVTTELASAGQASSETSFQEKTVTIYDRPRFLLGPTLGMGFGKDLRTSYGAFFLWRFAGPFWLGGSLDTTLAAKVHLALTF